MTKTIVIVTLVLIMDIMLPDMDGFEVCRRIRSHSELPILMLTARGEVTECVVGLELGRRLPG